MSGDNLFNLFAHVEDTINEGVAEHMTDSGHWMSDGGFAVFWMAIFMIAIAILVILVVRHIVDRNTMKNNGQVNSLDTVKERYAKGDITKKEYEQLKKDLE